MSKENFHRATQEPESGESVTTGGKPWIDSELKENITADTATSPKDDFHLYSNKDWILSNEIPDGYGSWSNYSACGLETKKKCMELLKDESLEGHDADLIRTLNSLVLDWDTRNSLGVSDYQEYLDKVLATNSIDDMIKHFTDPSTVNEYYDYVSYGAGTGLNDPEKIIGVISSPRLLLGDSAEYSERTEYGDIIYNYRNELFAYFAEKFGISKEDAYKYFQEAYEFEKSFQKKSILRRIGIAKIIMKKSITRCLLTNYAI